MCHLTLFLETEVHCRRDAQPQSPRHTGSVAEINNARSDWLWRMQNKIDIFNVKFDGIPFWRKPPQ